MSFDYIAHVVTTWVQTALDARVMVVWDAGLESPTSSTLWDNGTTNWIG